MNLKSSLTILSSLALLTGWASADVPKKQPLQKYSILWNNSPFTSKPIITGGPVEVDPFIDYALIGVAPIVGGYRVTMMNKKSPETRITVDSDNPKSTFKIVRVNRKMGDPLGTTVTMTSGSQTGTVSYDDKLLTLAVAKVAPAANGQPPQPGQINQPGQPPQGPGNNNIQRTPRPRVVPPPTPNGGAAVPQPAQAQPAQQNLQRPERRRN